MQQRTFRALEWMPTSVRMCGMTRRGEAVVGIHRNPWNNAAVFTGIYHCRNVTACPVCRESIMAKWRRELLRYIEALRDRGGEVLLFTGTVQHGAGDDAGKVRELVSRAFRSLTSGKGWRDYAKRFGYLGLVRVIEVTHSDYAGFHPHVHATLFLSKRTTEAERAAMRMFLIARWVQLVAREAGRLGLDVGLPSIDRGITLEHCNTAGEYVTKMGIAAEMTDPGHKVGRIEHRTMAQVAWDLTVSMRHGFKHRSSTDERILRRYVEAMRKTRIFQIGRGLAKRIDALELREGVVPELATNAVEAVEAEQLELVCEVPKSTYEDFQRVGGPTAEAELEMRVEDGAAELAVRRFISDVLSGWWRPPADVLWAPDPPTFAKCQTRRPVFSVLE